VRFTMLVDPSSRNAEAPYQRCAGGLLNKLARFAAPATREEEELNEAPPCGPRVGHPTRMASHFKAGVLF